MASKQGAGQCQPMHLLISGHCQGSWLSGVALDEDNDPYRLDQSFLERLMRFDGGQSSNGPQRSFLPEHCYFPLKIISNYSVMGNSVIS